MSEAQGSQGAPEAPAGKACCVPARGSPAAAGADLGAREPGPSGAAQPGTIAGDRSDDTPRLIPLPGGEFLMGTDSAEGFAEDGEGPARRVRVSPFAMAETTVTNAQFNAFVRATHYITEAEQFGSSFVFWLQLPPEQRAVVRRTARELPWWIPVEGACWQRPEGPGSSITWRPDHPVVHVSWHDAQAYCRWAGVGLPTEAQWEYAARGGLEGRRYAWGDALVDEGRGVCNLWKGRFPDQPAADGPPGPVAACSYAPNGFGLYQVTGNVWQWCADWFSPTYHQDTSCEDPLQSRPGGQRSMRGGSFLCHASYCNRYRVAGRSANTPSSAASNIGFRVCA